MSARELAEMPLWERDILGEQATAFLPAILNGHVEPDLPQSQGDIAHASLPGIGASIVKVGGSDG